MLPPVQPGYVYYHQNSNSLHWVLILICRNINHLGKVSSKVIQLLILVAVKTIQHWILQQRGIMGKKGWIWNSRIGEGWMWWGKKLDIYFHGQFITYPQTWPIYPLPTDPNWNLNGMDLAVAGVEAVGFWVRAAVQGGGAAAVWTSGVLDFTFPEPEKG